MEKFIGSGSIKNIVPQHDDLSKYIDIFDTMDKEWCDFWRDVVPEHIKECGEGVKRNFKRVYEHGFYKGIITGLLTDKVKINKNKGMKRYES